jgi:hypothetical protein
MSSQITAVSRQCRLQEWMEMVQSCKSRPVGMSVDEWCDMNSITKANYYYRKNQVRKAYLEMAVSEEIQPAIVPVSMESLSYHSSNLDATDRKVSSLELSVNGISLTVTEETSMEMLARVLEVMIHVK